MTILQQENFDVGTNGNAVNLGSTIFSEGLNAVYAAGIQLADTGHAALINPAGTATGYLINSGFTATGKSMMRITFMITALPSIDTIIARIDNGTTVTGLKGGDILITAAGKLRLRNGSTQVVVSTSTIPLNTPVALEWLIDPAGNTQTVRYFTTLGKTASPVETISGAYTVVEQATQYLLGKNTGSTWTGGITIDGYKRGDDWWATATPDAWNEHFVGTSGSNFATDSNVGLIVNTIPKFAVGGPHTDQSVLAYLAGAGNDSWIRSVGFGAGAVDGYDRFYFSVNAQPTERQGLWMAVGGSSVIAFSLVIAPGAGAGNFQVELWRSEDYKNPFSDTNQPLGTSGDMKIGIWDRIDCRAWQDASGQHAEIRIFKGPAKNLDFGNESYILTGTSDVGGVRYRYLVGKATAPGGSAVGVFFDEWRAHPSAWVGPLDSSEQADPAVGVNWAVSQWRGGVEVPLTLGLAAWGPVSGVDTFRVRGGQYQKKGVPFAPVGFNVMAASLPIGSESIGGPGVDAWDNWQNNSVGMMAALKDSWKVDTVRLQLGQAGMDPQGSNYSQAYVDRALGVVATLRDNGFITIVSMQDQDPVNGNNHKLPTAHTQRAWQKFLGDATAGVNSWTAARRGGVGAEIFNEPQMAGGGDGVITPSVNDWSQWRDGGHPSGAVTQANNLGDLAVGHQQVLETIRATGFTGVVIADAIDLGHTLSGLPKLTDTLANSNVGYAIHTQRFHYVNGNTSTQDRTQIWEPRWKTPRDALGIAVISTEWSLRRMVDSGFTTGLKAATPDFLDWMRDNFFGMTPWAIDTATTDFAYVIAHSGGNAWVANDWDAWDPLTLPSNTGAGELLFARYPTWTPVQTKAIDITQTTQQKPIIPPTTLRFSGDPGIGKIYLGWNSGPTDEWEYHYALQSELQAVDPGGTYAPDSTIAGGWRRVFRPGGFDSDPGPGYTPKPTGDDPWGNLDDNTAGAHWSLARQTAANCDIVCINFVFDSISGDFINGIFDPWIDMMATKIQQIKDKYGAATIITPSNEPDQGQKGHNNDYNFYQRLRKVSRRLHFELLARDVDRDAFEISGPNPMGGTHQNHVANFANHKADGFAQSGTSTHGNINTVYQMLANWKGTITEAGGTFWKNAYDPNPADFWLPGDTDGDPWGYGTGPTARCQVVNSYCDHGWHGVLADMSQAAYESHVFSDSTQGYGSQNDFHGGHAGAQQRFLRALYGGDGFPLIVGEWGYYGRDPLVGGTNVVDMPLTREAGERYIADLIADNVAAISWWRNDLTRTVNGTTYTGAPGPHSFGYRHANGESDGIIVVDGPAQSNMNRKMFSVMFQQTAATRPTSRGSDTPAGGKPLANQHN